MVSIDDGTFVSDDEDRSNLQSCIFLIQRMRNSQSTNIMIKTAYYKTDKNTFNRTTVVVLIFWKYIQG